MKQPEKEQRGFSSILFDTLFGLLLFLSFETLFSIRSLFEGALYFFVLIVLLHWWLLFKSADDRFGTEVSDSILDIVLGVGYLVLLELLVFSAKEASLTKILIALLSLLTVDILWCVFWRYVGKWKTKKRSIIASMETELDQMIRIDLGFFVAFFLLLALAPLFSAPVFFAIVAIVYGGYILFTHWRRILDINWF